MPYPHRDARLAILRICNTLPDALTLPLFPLTFSSLCLLAFFFLSDHVSPFLLSPLLVTQKWRQNGTAREPSLKRKDAEELYEEEEAASDESKEEEEEEEEEQEEEEERGGLDGKSNVGKYKMWCEFFLFTLSFYLFLIQSSFLFIRNIIGDSGFVKWPKRC